MWGKAEFARRPVLLAPLALAACQADVLDPKGAIGLADRQILIDSLAIMLAVGAPTILAVFAFAWWFRASNSRARHLPEWSDSGRVELVTWSIPMLVILLLGGVAWIGAHDLDPAEKLPGKTPPLEIQAVSLDWKWLFIYPSQHVAAVNQLVVPAGTPLHFLLTSASVMNAFFVPQLGSMIYTMNGMTDELNLIADQPGTFRGLSSHYSGDGFSGMHFDVRAVKQADFDAWLTATRATGATLDDAAYTGLSRQSMEVKPFTYRDVAPGLFQRIETQKLPPGPGPEQTAANPFSSSPTGH